MAKESFKELVIQNQTSHPRTHYKLRQLTFGNKTGEAFGITVPQIAVSKFSGTFLRFAISGNCFMYIKEEINKMRELILKNI